VNIEPSGGPYAAGDVLTCTSDGHPEPSYTWTDSDAEVVSTGRTTVLYEGWFNLTCTATGNFTTPCSASNTVSGNASGKLVTATIYAPFVSLYRLSQVQYDYNT